MDSPEVLPSRRQPIRSGEKWREDFPVDEDRDHFVARRDFTKFLILISGGFTVGQFWMGFWTWFRGKPLAPNALRVAAIDAIPVGGSRLFHFPTERDSCILVRVKSDEFVAFSNRCTHLMCPVVPKVAEGRFHCPCHNGFFDIRTGRPTAGPPQRALPRIRLEVRGRDVYATGVEVTST